MTVQNIIDDVRYRLNETTAAFWTDAELMKWINEGQDNLIARLPVEALSSLAAVATVDLSATTSKGSLPGSFIRLEKGEVGGHQITKMDIKFRHALKNNTYFLDEDSDPYFAIVWNNELEVFPATGSVATLYYIKRPATMAATTSSPSIPSFLHHLIVIYTTGRAKQKQEEWQSAQALFGEYERYIAEIRRMYENREAGPWEAPYSIKPEGVE